MRRNNKKVMFELQSADGVALLSLWFTPVEIWGSHKQAFGEDAPYGQGKEKFIPIPCNNCTTPQDA